MNHVSSFDDGCLAVIALLSASWINLQLEKRTRTLADMKVPNSLRVNSFIERSQSILQASVNISLLVLNRKYLQAQSSDSQHILIEFPQIELKYQQSSASQLDRLPTSVDRLTTGNYRPHLAFLYDHPPLQTVTESGILTM